MTKLVCTYGVDTGLKHNIHGAGCLVGRANDCDVQVRDAATSRYHCRIAKGRDGFYVEDLGSKNGIKFEDGRLRGLRRRVEVGQLIGIGNSVYVLTR